MYEYIYLPGRLCSLENVSPFKFYIITTSTITLFFLTEQAGELFNAAVTLEGCC